jgi:hypothetical protein
MKIELLGVVRDGSPRAGHIPANSARTLEWPLGEAGEIAVTVVREDGSAVSLEPTDRVVISVKKTSQQSGRTPGFRKEGTRTPPDARNRVVLTVEPTDTRAMLPGRFVYDCWLVRADGRHQLVPLSAFLLGPAATLP